MPDIAPPKRLASGVKAGADRAFVPAALALIVISCAVKLLGFAEKQLIAYRFGLDGAVDAWFVAVTVPTILFLLTRELIEPAYLPVFMGHLESGDPKRGEQLFTSLMAMISLVGVIAAVGVYLTARPLASLLGPGFSAETAGQAASFLRASILGSVFLSVSSLTYITLNGYRQFAAPASGDLVVKLVSIGCIVFLASDLGLFALALGFVLGAMGRLAIHSVAIGRRQLSMMLTGGWGRRDDMHAFLVLMAPLVVGVVFAQLSDLAANYFSTLAGAGAVAARTFAKKIVDLPVVLVPYALSVVAFPHFIGLINRNEWDSLHRLLAQILSGLALLFSSLTVALIALSEPVVALLFQRGAFDADATRATAAILTWYATGLVAFAVEPLLVSFYFSLRDTRTPVLVGIICVVIEIAFAAALVESWGASGIAAALALSKSIKIAILWALLRRSWPWLLAPAGWTVMKILAGVTAASVVIVAATTAWPAPSAAEPLYVQFVYCAAIGALSLAAHLAVAVAVPSAERDLLARFLGRSGR